VQIIYKNIGETPLDALNRLRCEKPEFAGAKLSYAGRLDPMAEGLLLVLVGEENNEREKYLGLDKEYEAEILFGIETDSYDALGIIKNSKSGNKNPDEGSIKDYLKKSEGAMEQEYPPFSSKTVGGIPLWSIARKGQNPILPKRKVEIYKAELSDMNRISAEKIREKVFESIQKVNGDFRQQEILESWGKALEDKDKVFDVALIRLFVSGGFYVRTFAHKMGKAFGMGAIALSIKRTRIGDEFLNK